MRLAILFSSIALSVMFVGCDQQSCSVQGPKAVVRSESNSETSNTSELAETKLISVKVTGMMCPHSCLKDIKSLISKTNDVESIELTPQKEADVIDNPVVLVRYRGELHKEATTKAILAAGFDNVEYTE
jgi:hypothetical protein